MKNNINALLNITFPRTLLFIAPLELVRPAFAHCLQQLHAFAVNNPAFKSTVHIVLVVANLESL